MSDNPTSTYDKRKLSLYFAKEVLEVVLTEADEQGLPVSRIVTDCIKLVIANLGVIKYPPAVHAFKDRARAAREIGAEI